MAKKYEIRAKMLKSKGHFGGCEVKGWRIGSSGPKSEDVKGIVYGETIDDTAIILHNEVTLEMIQIPILSFGGWFKEQKDI